MKLLEKIKALLILLLHPLSVWWSNFRWRKSRKEYALEKEDMRRENETIISFAKRAAEQLMRKFEYKYDGIDELYDSTPPPAEIYARYCEGDAFRDDCDGFHAALYHVLTRNDIECSLVEILSLSNAYGHCTLTFVDEDGEEHLIDYLSDRPRQKGDTVIDIVEKEYSSRAGRMAIYRVKFDYISGKYWTVNSYIK